MSLRFRSGRAALLAVSVAAAGCDLVQDLPNRFKTCKDAEVDLVNSEQTRSAYHIAIPGEGFSDTTLLGSGASRRVSLCLERGDRKEFRAGHLDGRVAGVVTCVTDHAMYEGVLLKVVWSVGGFSCRGW